MTDKGGSGVVEGAADAMMMGGEIVAASEEIPKIMKFNS
jgi:hypothetical protein